MPSAKIVSRRKRSAAEQIEEAEDGALVGLDEILEALGIHAGDRQVTAEAIHRQHRQGEHDTLPKIRDPKDVR